jgi:hypothetical protein
MQNLSRSRPDGRHNGGTLLHQDDRLRPANSHGGDFFDLGVFFANKEAEKPFFDSGLLTRIMQVCSDRPRPALH